MLSYQNESDKIERRRLIATAIAFTVIILALIVAIIVVTVKKSTRTNLGEVENNSFALVDDNSEEELTDSTEEKTTDAVEVNTQTANIGVLSIENSESDSSKAQLPSTGPEDVLPIAIMSGMLVMYLSSVIMAKKNS